MKLSFVKIFIVIILLSSCLFLSFAEQIDVGSNCRYKSLEEALQKSVDGDTLVVNAGIYPGNYIIDKSIVLIGKNNPVIDGQNRGTVLTIESPNVVIKGFTIQNTGILLDREDSGILVTADNVSIEQNQLKEVLFGIYFRKADGGILKNNLIEGKKELDIPRRGDLFRGWYCKNLLIEGNTFKYGRDVILWFSHQSEITGNNISGARYGLHFMYNSDCRISGNIMTYNSVGIYMMYSKNLVMENNLMAYNRGPSGFGIGFKDLDNVDLNKNVIADNRVGIFVDNTPRAVDSYVKYSGNVIAFNETGIEEMSLLINSYFSGNSFIDNYNQAQLSNTQQPDNDFWKGNYWSDYSGYDKDRDGAGDIPYKSEEFVENLIGDKPELKLFLYSPAISALNYASKAFPILQPSPRLIDKSPMTRPVMPAGVPVLKIQKETGFILLSFLLTIFSALFILLFFKTNKLTSGRSGNRHDRIISMNTMRNL